MGLGGPDERLGIVVVHLDVLLDGSGQFWHAAKHAIAQPLGRDIAKESLDHVEPGR